MTKIDFKKELKHLYRAPSKEPVLVEVPRMQFLMVDGTGAPENSKGFQEGIQILYGLAYTLKFSLKKAGQGPDYTIPPLEGLWWMEGDGPFDLQDQAHWLWTLMIMQPDHIGAPHFAEAVRSLGQKEPELPLSKARLAAFSEGSSAQIMHVGPYSAEPATIEKLHEFVKANGYELRGRHHEIYLGDPRRTSPEKLKTVLRHPVRRIR